MPGWGQIVDGKNLAEDATIEYLEISAIWGPVTRKVIILVDYGQVVYVGTNTTVEAPNGSTIKFNSIMDAVNRFAGWGWELYLAHDVNAGNGDSIYHYVMRRKKK